MAIVHGVYIDCRLKTLHSVLHVPALSNTVHHNSPLTEVVNQLLALHSLETLTLHSLKSLTLHSLKSLINSALTEELNSTLTEELN